MTTVEARGTTQPNAGCREHNRRGDLGRAAGAQLTGQCQDGPICAPVTTSSTPGRLTDGRGPGRPKGTRIFWTCAYCLGRCAESRMVCTFCFRERREATS